jgi:hypothetical protein
MPYQLNEHLTGFACQRCRRAFWTDAVLLAGAGIDTVFLVQQLLGPTLAGDQQLLGANSCWGPTGQILRNTKE